MRRISQQLPFRRFVLGLKSCFGNCEEEKNPPMGIGTSSYVTRHLFFGFLPFPSLCFFSVAAGARKAASREQNNHLFIYLIGRRCPRLSQSRSAGREEQKEAKCQIHLTRGKDEEPRKRNLFFFFVDDREGRRGTLSVPVFLWR